jgi:hypothetical protein
VEALAQFLLVDDVIDLFHLIARFGERISRRRMDVLEEQGAPGIGPSNGPVRHSLRPGRPGHGTGH